MHLPVFLLVCVLWNTVSCTKERKMVEILDIVRRIEEHIIKEDRLREIADIIRIESTVDKLNTKLDRVLTILDDSEPLTMGRSAGSTAVMPRGLEANIEAIDGRLRSLEASVSNVEQSMAKIDIDGAKMEEIERRTTQLKDDMNTKMRKMMNVMSALYEMNKEIKVNMGSRVEGQDQPTSGTGTSYASEFLIENLEELERKITEQFSVLSSELRSEITSLKIVASSVGSSNCETPSEIEEEEWMTPQNNARSAITQNARKASNKVESTLDNLVESLGRSTREIRAEIHQGMQDIDIKLQNLTVLAQSHPQCDTQDASESIISIRRAAAPPPIVPQQSLDEKRTPRITTCTKTAQNVPNPKSCADLRKGGASCDGIYVIFPKGVRAVRVLCDMTSDGGGWTVLMRRGDYGEKMSNFNKNWLSYKNGFGDVEGEFWIGNDVMNLMTTEEENFLRVHMSAFDGDEIDLDFASFSVGNESSNYLLHIGVPIGTPSAAANSLRYHNNRPFSTFDRKNDGFDQNCAATYKGGWWFNGCYFGFLTGEYFNLGDKRENWQGMLWYDWKGNAALKGASMMIRPKSFTGRV